MVTIDEPLNTGEFQIAQTSAFFHSELSAFTPSVTFSKVARPVISVMDTSASDILLNQLLSSTGIVA